MKTNTWRCALVCGPLLLGMGFGTALAAAPSLVTVQAAPGIGPVLGGRVIPAFTVTLRAQLPGRVKFVAGEAGMPIAPGQPLVALDDDQLLAQKAQAIAAYQADEVALHNGYSQYGYQLYSYDPPSFMNPFTWIGQGFKAMMGNSQNPWATYQSNLENRKATALKAQTQLEASAWRIRQIEAEMNNSVSIAPFQGVVLAKEVNPGDIVQPGQPLMVLGSGGPKQLLVKVPESLAGNLNPGQSLPVHLGDNAGMVNGRVVHVAPQANPQTHTVAVKVSLPRNAAIRVGAYATISLPSYGRSAQNEPAIPQSALIPGTSLPSVLVDHHGVTEMHVLRLGGPLPDGQIQVLAGLRVGQIIVNDPPAGIGSGYQLQTSASSGE
ncbi:efflux RND transporter periplasmic adaptor subunit [Acidithiobacillus thiooxidans]|uniref:efflux RND transporter periplasmic adaptor subunit n=1 Tax=Acidithiobacillus thiooxidans TaxID=930 RepID=UPI001C076516|nr:efflux RND transporter periplasmic adaptor subunit [Acidithiobacillus thiooxidans]MBU2841826.1 efflux RND transporter periplasmic adaptor subunit [Acidithiobacillus thiooxidans]